MTEVLTHAVEKMQRCQWWYKSLQLGRRAANDRDPTSKSKGQISHHVPLHSKGNVTGTAEQVQRWSWLGWYSQLDKGQRTWMGSSLPCGHEVKHWSHHSNTSRYNYGRNRGGEHVKVWSFHQKKTWAIALRVLETKRLTYFQTFV